MPGLVKHPLDHRSGVPALAIRIAERLHRSPGQRLESPPDWIVLDLELVDGRGEDVLRHVRESQLPSRVAVLSGMIGPENLSRLKPLKPNAMLEIPIQSDDLIKLCAG